MRRRRGIFSALTAMAAIALLAVPVVFAAPNGPTAGQKVDMKVLLLAPNATDGVYLAWQDTLTKLGVPYTAYVAGQSPRITDGTLADYGGNHAKYQAVILASSAVALLPAERTALDKLETTFGAREISDNTNPDFDHGATPIAGVSTTATTTLVGTLTAAGKAVFPYLKGNVPLGGPGFAASGTPGPLFNSLVNAPGGGSYMGVWTRSNATEQLVDGIPGNGAQSHFQLLRYGMLNWVTRGVYLGYWRNYFEVQVDDLFLGDDNWVPATHTNNYDPAAAIRMTPGDLAQALTWSQANNFRFDFAFNAGGHDQFVADHGANSDTLWNAFAGDAGAPYRGGFGFINHTYDHPFLGCSTTPFITAEITSNLQSGMALGLPVTPTELVTGEHSGLANTKPGNPGVLDPPSFDQIDASNTTGATLAPGTTYFYAATVSNAHGQTPSPAPVSVALAPVVPPPVPPATTPAASPGENTVTVNVSTVCFATTYSLYRSTSATGPWSLVAQKTQAANTPTDNGVTETSVNFVDTGAVGSPATPPVADTAVMDPYPMNASFTAGLANAGVAITATDASKTYPVDPAQVGGAQYPAGSTFNLTAPTGQVINTVPRYPTNVYYNTATQGQELDEYNWIYTAPAAGGGCVPIPNVTTCNTGPVTWEQFLASERSIVFGHIVGNDPKPHYSHQSNFAQWIPGLAETSPTQGGILYPYLGNILGFYRGLYADNAPIVQLSMTDINTALTRQQTWAANVAAGAVTGYIQDNVAHIITTVAMQVPVTGTTQGQDYAGMKSAWLTVGPGETLQNLQNPIVVSAASAKAAIAKAKAQRPALTRLKMSTRKFAAARTGLAKRKSRTVISWKLNLVADVKIKVQRKIVHTIKKNKKVRKKITWRTVGTITKKKARVGTTRLTFAGKLAKHKLTKGDYRLVATAKAGSFTSPAKRLNFTVIKL